jgi:hypothetical protein
MNWKKQLMKGLPGIFSNSKVVDDKKDEELKSRLYLEIGQLRAWNLTALKRLRQASLFG